MFLRWLSHKAALAYPVPPAPPTAVLVPWFRSNGRIRVFENGWGPEASAFAPAAVAGCWQQLEDLMREPSLCLTHAVIVLATSPDELLTEVQRDRLWHAFRVPIFEQLVDENGAVFAAECEAHDGVHIESAALHYDPNCVVSEPCGCGRATPRLKTAPARLQSVAAYAR